MISLLLLIVEVWMFAGLVILLHYYSSRFGFAPFLFSMGALAVLMQAQLGVYVQPLPGLYMFFTSNVLLPVVLMSILVIYIADGAVPARMTIIGILGITLLVLVVQFIYRAHLSLPDGGNLAGLPVDDLIPRLNPRITLASVVAYLADMLAIAIFYQGAKNLATRIPEWAVIGLALLASLWTDAILFHLIAELGTGDFFALLPGDVIGKTFSALILWPPLAYYLTVLAPKMPHHLGGKNRRTLDVLFGSLEEMRMALVRTETALEKSEAERQKEADYLHLISDQSAEALWLADVEHYEHPFYVNAAYERIWGRSAASLYADSLSFVRSIHPEDQARLLATLPDYDRDNKETEYRIIRPDGSIRWVRDRSFPIRNEKGEIYRIAGIAEDITERKEVEIKSLELAVEREKVKLLRDFVSDASHDLKAPLTAINLKVYALSRTDSPERRQSLVKDLEQISMQMGNMIDDLLTLARLEAVDDLKVIPLEIDQMIADICQPLRPLAEAKKLEVKLDLPKIDVQMLADASDLSRALTNLIQNAIRYTPEGGQVSVEAELRAERVIIRVRDTGIGIAEEDLPYIFKRFFRAPNGRSTDPNGTGLGLAIVKKIVDHHHGQIECSSELGKGTVFTVTLPIVG